MIIVDIVTSTKPVCQTKKNSENNQNIININRYSKRDAAIFKIMWRQYHSVSKKKLYIGNTEFTRLANVLGYNVLETPSLRKETFILSLKDSLETHDDGEPNILINVKGACCVIVITVGNTLNDPSSNPGRGCLHFIEC